MAEFKEQDIRPQALMDKYIDSSISDIKDFFKGPREDINCPACENVDSSYMFSKNKFAYSECNNCNSIFLSQRPTLDEFEQYYKNSASAKFWATEFFPRVAEARREKIFKPRAERIFGIINSKQLPLDVITDVGAGFGLFLEEISKLSPKSKLNAVEPGENLAEVCRSKGFNVLETIAEDAKEFHGQADLVTCFEVIEHVHSPIEFIKSLKLLCKNKGHVVVSGLGGDGFDIRLLWKNSKGIMPPHHINFLSVEGLEILFKRAGFKDINVITPGELDFDIVVNNIELLQDSPLSRFIDTIKRRGVKAEKDFQSFLKNNCLSSHVWVIAKND